LEKAKVDVIKWKRMTEDNKGKHKEEAPQEASQYLEKKLQHMQENFQIMTIQKV